MKEHSLMQKKPLIIAGPCSAETEAQVMEVAEQLALLDIDLFRAGVWKPRTRPGSFEGVGIEALPWLQNVKNTFGLKTTTEVANANHVEQALKADIDVLWIGARTTVNPFSVQEIANALSNVDKPIFIKNPIHPDISLWIGAIERFLKSGQTQIGAIHRGFYQYGERYYRNRPLWEIPIELRRRFPNLPLICDNSHICGRRDTLEEVAIQATRLGYDGFMTEVHNSPDEAWSDAKQQITPENYKKLLDKLKIEMHQLNQQVDTERLFEDLRRKIDDIDQDMLNHIVERMELVKEIGAFKKQHSISIYQPKRWEQIMIKIERFAQEHELSVEHILTIFRSIHQESIRQQQLIFTEK